MGHTIGENIERKLPRDRRDSNHRQNPKTLMKQQSSHANHTKNYSLLRLRESEFKELIQTKLPKIGLVTFITAAYFTVESYGCLQNEGAPEDGVRYCYESTGDDLIEKCGNNSCKEDGGLGKCEDIIHR